MEKANLQNGGGDFNGEEPCMANKISPHLIEFLGCL
jgi:hypothetical protein